ncbi:MAG: thermonuclease family protein [Cyanobacteria bacterium J06632_3]
MVMRGRWQKLQQMRGWVPLVCAIALATATRPTALVHFSQSVLGQRLSSFAEFIALAPGAGLSETWLVVPGSVYDGDTLRVGRDGQELKIRLCGVDAPERDQPLGLESRDYLRSLLDQNPYGKIIVVPVEEDRYGRTVAELFLWPDDDPGQEISINSEMLMAGMAYVYEQYVDGCPNGSVFRRAEAIGQEAKAGVWAGDYQRPWDYRE